MHLFNSIIHSFSMASSFQLVAFFSLLFISASFSVQPDFKPKTLLLQVTKDPKTLQYLTQTKQRTPLVPLSLTVDLSGRYFWTDCDTNGYVSSTYKFYDCHSPQCLDSKEGTFCGSSNYPLRSSHNSSCTNFNTANTVAQSGANGELASDVVSIQSTNGQNPTRVVSVPELLFVCTDNQIGLLKGLADGVTGIAGFGRAYLSLSSQFPRLFNYRRIFAICLSPSSKGVIFLGDEPYQFLPNVNAVTSLTYTPLIVNRGWSITYPYTDYYIGVTSIKVNGLLVPINTTFLSFDINGAGGTIISTVDPYTVLQPVIYDPFVDAFAKAMSNFTRVGPVAPFEVCYDSKNIETTHVGPSVPVIDLVLQSEDVFWRINGANSMVQVSKDVFCLGFVKPTEFRYPSISIGGYQLENKLLQFNVAKSQIGFSSQTICANFNFTSTA